MKLSETIYKQTRDYDPRKGPIYFEIPEKGFTLRDKEYDSEAAFEKDLRRFLTENDCYLLPKVVSAAEKGLPDIMGCFKGKFFAFELKTESFNDLFKRQWSDTFTLQMAQLYILAGRGGLTAFVSPKEVYFYMTYLFSHGVIAPHPKWTDLYEDKLSIVTAN